MWPLELIHKVFLNFTKCPSFKPDMANFELIPDFMKTNIFTKFHDYWTKNVASRAYTRQKVVATEVGRQTQHYHNSSH